MVAKWCLVPIVRSELETVVPKWMSRAQKKRGAAKRGAERRIGKWGIQAGPLAPGHVDATNDAKISLGQLGQVLWVYNEVARARVCTSSTYISFICIGIVISCFYHSYLPETAHVCAYQQCPIEVVWMSKFDPKPLPSPFSFSASLSTVNGCPNCIRPPVSGGPVVFSSKFTVNEGTWFEVEVCAS